MRFRINVKMLLALAILPFACFNLPHTAAAQITGAFTVDNSYAVYIGDANGVIGVPTPTLNGNALSNPVIQATNSKFNQITKGENFAFDLVPRCNIYLVAWSDDGGLQGAIGTFAGALQISTGDPRIRVTPSFNNKGNNDFPTLAEVDKAIKLANSNNSWVTPAKGGTLSNSSVMSVLSGTSVPGLSPTAEWVWYDSGKQSTGVSPFKGFNHDEFLVFNIPCDSVTDDADGVGNGDVLTGTKADPVDIGTLEPAAPSKSMSCCPPFDANWLNAMFKPEFQSGANGPYRMTYTSQAQLNVQMQAYINYLHALDTSVTEITIHLRLGDVGQAGTVPSNNGAAIANTPDQYISWSHNGNGTPSGISPGFWSAYTLQPNRQYVLHTGMYLNSSAKMQLTNDCAGNKTTFAWIAQPMANARVKGEFVIGTGSTRKSAGQREYRVAPAAPLQREPAKLAPRLNRPAPSKR